MCEDDGIELTAATTKNGLVVCIKAADIEGCELDDLALTLYKAIQHLGRMTK